MSEEARVLGAVCKRGHLRRRSAGHSCLECHAENMRARYAKNPQPHRAAARKWLKANPGKIVRKPNPERDRENDRRRRARERLADPQRASNKVKAWIAANPEKARVLRAEMARRRRAAKHGAQGSHTRADLDEIFKAQRGRCAYCRCKLDGYHVDHVMAISRGGWDDRSNLQLTCPTCNRSKSARDPVEFAQSLGLLI